MSHVMDWANQNQGFVALIAACTTFVFSGVVAGATVWYARLTSHLVSETVALRKVETDPDIGIHLEIHAESVNTIDMVVRNVGQGPAYDVTFTVEPDEPLWQDRRLTTMALFQRGLEYMPPGQEFRFILGTYTQLRKEPFTITVRYRGKESALYFVAPYTIHVTQFDGTHAIGEPPLKEAVRYLKEMASNLNELASGRSEVHVEVERFLMFRRRSPYPWVPLRWHERAWDKMIAIARHLSQRGPRLPMR